jgi:hypothetical protein
VSCAAARSSSCKAPRRRALDGERKPGDLEVAADRICDLALDDQDRLLFELLQLGSYAVQRQPAQVHGRPGGRVEDRGLGPEANDAGARQNGGHPNRDRRRKGKRRDRAGRSGRGRSAQPTELSALASP